ncbi:MAG: hypothetical protein GX149_00365 [Acholeplasmataceae bacterium]|jgi:V/A-type H+-transporting ATPase subunit I|nr:hypothetical protein [Acholeplasmataceae bacterium]
MIIPVKKVQLFVVEKQVEPLLKLLQKQQILMAIEKEDSQKEDITVDEQLLVRVRKAIKHLENIQQKRKFFDYKTATYEDFDDRSQKYLKLLESVEAAEEIVNNLATQLKEVEAEIKLFVPFEANILNLKAMQETKYTNFYHGFIYEKALEDLKAFFEKHQILYQTFQEDKKGVALSFALLKETEQTYYQEIRRLDFKEVEFPNFDGTVNDYLLNLYHEQTTIIQKLNEAVNHIEGYIKDLDQLYIYADQLASDIKRKQTPLKNVSKRLNIINLTGWVREDHTEKLQVILKDSKLDYEIEIYDPDEHEIPPTALKNNKFVKNFEIITEQYSVPNHKELDPNPALSFWYWMIFGMMMGDIGYGLIMLLGFGLFLKLKKPKGGTKKLIGVFYYSGYTTVLFGILYGSLFGFSFDLGKYIGLIFGQNWTTVLLVPMEDALQMLIYAIIIGAIHIIHGLILKAILLFKLKDPFGALGESFSYIFILIGLGFFALTLVNLPFKLSPWFAYSFLILGALLIILFMGRKSKSIFGKIGASLSGFYGLIGQLSDILSYSRILALSLSTAVIGYTFNILAGMLQGNIFGIFISIFVYLIGHVFNFAMGMLSSYIHNSRLQYVEFFSKFYEGGGYLFEPLALELNYLNEIKNIDIVGGI